MNLFDSVHSFFIINFNQTVKIIQSQIEVQQSEIILLFSLSIIYYDVLEISSIMLFEMNVRLAETSLYSLYQLIIQINVRNDDKQSLSHKFINIYKTP